MQAQIITIGDEILIGQVIDTNSAWLAENLTQLGFSITAMLSVSDNENAIKTAISQALDENNLVVITGGLGPTKDDITKNTLCKLLNTELEFNETVYADVQAFLLQRGSKMNVLNRDQALFPKLAQVLRNLQGTAPGIWFEKDDRVIISLPGVPSEMKAIFQDKVITRLNGFFKLPVIYNQTIMVTGLGESQLALTIESWENQLPTNVKLAYLPSPGIVRLRLGITGSDLNNLKAILQAEIAKLTKIIPANIFSDIGLTLQEVVGNLLTINNKTISIAESCTGGKLAQMLTSVPGSSVYFKGSVVAYANQVKTDILGVPNEIINNYGAVSQQVVEQMAKGVRQLLKTDFAIATSGIAGPGGGTDDKPVGLVWVAISGPNGTKSHQFLFGKERDINIKRSAIAALNMLRITLSNSI